MRALYLGIGIFLLAAVGGGWYFFFLPSPAATELPFALAPVRLPSEQEALVRKVPEGWREYRSEWYGFSLRYPAELTVSERKESARSYSVVFEDAKKETGFQIYIVAYKGETITDEQFLNDSPLGVRDEPQALQVGGVSAVHFLGKDVNLGPTAEVWFIHRGHLFEVATVRELDAWLMEILGTWRFL